jgi:hypothetical protein
MLPSLSECHFDRRTTWTPSTTAISKRITNEVATRVVSAATPTLYVYHHSIHTEGDARSPYIHTLSCPDSKVCSSARYGTTWMSKRRIILRWVTDLDVLLELWSHRFGKWVYYSNDSEHGRMLGVSNHLDRSKTPVP